MVIDCEDVRRLASVCRDAQEDLFCVTGVLPSYQAISSLFSFHEEQTLLVLPGMFAVPDRMITEDISPKFSRSGFPLLRVFVLSDGIIAADVLLLADGEFRAFCEHKRVVHMIVPFAELADEKEYGSRASYGWIGEWRASLPYLLRVTCLFSEALPDYSTFIAGFASPGCTVVNMIRKPTVYAYHTDNVKAKYFYTRELAQRHSVCRTAVFFTDRREAEEFLRYIKKTGADIIYINGETDAENSEYAFEAFMNGQGFLIATKSALASCLFYRADDVIFCGVPYSKSFMTRCASFADNGTIACCFCPKDIDVDINILKCFSENRPEDEREPFLTATLQKLLEVKQMLSDA